jgi:hypothetical protein
MKILEEKLLLLNENWIQELEYQNKELSDLRINILNSIDEKNLVSSARRRKSSSGGASLLINNKKKNSARRKTSILDEKVINSSNIIIFIFYLSDSKSIPRGSFISIT